MTRRLRLLLTLAIGAVAVSGFTSAGQPSRPPATASQGSHLDDQVRTACEAVTTPGRARCFARYVAPRPGQRRAGAKAPQGFRPADLHNAYGLPATGGAGHTVAVIGAFDDPRVASDLTTFRARFGLPPCTKATGCLRVVNQRGQTSPLPQPDVDWATEISLDLDMVSASCPSCALMLVEADSANISDLGTGVDSAVRLGADVVSNSYGIAENNGVLPLAHYYQHPGVAIVAATGDYGFGPASFPAVLPSVIAVGGTSLSRSGSSWRSHAWSGSGSGCSAYVPKPAWQHDSHCTMRVVADVSAVADPGTGPAFYDSYGYVPANGWMVGGGTSAAAPLIAGMIGSTPHPDRVSSSSYLYGHRSGFRDVIGGSNGFCGGDYLCTARPGYDAPTGLGSPYGLGGLGG